MNAFRTLGTTLAVVLIVFPVFLSDRTLADSCGERPCLVVIVDVFSGRPNPSFRLEDPKQSGALREAFSWLPSFSVSAEQEQLFNRLGYRGILLKNPQGLPGVPAKARILAGMARVTDGLADRYLKDGESRIEKLLLRLAKQRGLIEDLLARGIVPDPGMP